MNTPLVNRTLFVLGGITAVAYILIGVIAGVMPSMWEDSDTESQVMWIVFLTGGGLVLIAGLWLSRSSPWVGAALISVGAIVGGFAIFWAVVPPFVALAIVVLSIINARNTSATPAPST